MRAQMRANARARKWRGYEKKMRFRYRYKIRICFFRNFFGKKIWDAQKTLSLLLLLVPAKERRNPKKKNRATCSLASASFTPKKTQKNRRKRRERAILPSERERWKRGGTLWASHFTRTTTHDFIMALRQTLKQFTSKTTAFAPLLSRASGVQMYSTVIEGLKYASSHEWCVITQTRSPNHLCFGWTFASVYLLLWCSGTHFFVFFLSLLFSYPFVTRTFHVHIA